MGQECSANCSPCDEVQIIKENRDFNYYGFIESNIMHSKLIQSEHRRKFVQIVASEGFFSLFDGKALLFSQKLGYYEGDINEDREAHGKGTLTSLDWDVYKGQFQNNKFHGIGTIRNKQNNIWFQAVWQKGLPLRGTLYNGKQNTIKTQLKEIRKLLPAKKYYAKVTLPNNLTYAGQFIQKQKMLVIQGTGFMQFPDGSTYNGDWFEGRMEGLGRYQWPNGNYYEGNYSSGKRNGKGKMFFHKENTIYEGVWYKGQAKIQSFIDQQIGSSSQQSQHSLVHS